MPPRKSNPIPEYVSARFVSVCLGKDYRQTVAAMHETGLRSSGPDKLFRWVDVEDALGRRFISYDAIERIAQHIDPGNRSTASYDVSQEIYDMAVAAWAAKGSVPQGVMKARAAPKKRGRPPKPKSPDDAAPSNDAVRLRIEEERRLQQEITQERLAGHRETNEFKRLQASRLAGLLCDRATVKAKNAEVGASVRRFIMDMPARVTGYIQQIVALTEEELNLLEKSLGNEAGAMIAELRRDIERIDRDAAGVAQQRRFGERGGAAAEMSAV